MPSNALISVSFPWTLDSPPAPPPSSQNLRLLRSCAAKGHQRDRCALCLGTAIYIRHIYLLVYLAARASLSYSARLDPGAWIAPSRFAPLSIFSLSIVRFSSFISRLRFDRRHMSGAAAAHALRTTHFRQGLLALLKEAKQATSRASSCTGVSPPASQLLCLLGLWPKSVARGGGIRWPGGRQPPCVPT